MTALSLTPYRPILVPLSNACAFSTRPATDTLKSKGDTHAFTYHSSRSALRWRRWLLRLLSMGNGGRTGNRGHSAPDSAGCVPDGRITVNVFRIRGDALRGIY